MTEESLYLGIQEMKSGNHLSDISRAIQNHAESHGYSLVKEFGGHGIGKRLHEDPMVLNYVANGRGIKLQTRPGPRHRAHGQHGYRPGPDSFRRMDRRDS